MGMDTDRRGALQAFGLAVAAGAASVSGLLSGTAEAATAKSMVPQGASALDEFMRRLAATPRRRDFKTVPMILNSPDQWDHEALEEVFNYKPAAKQCWDNTDIAGSWLNVMRNSINAQVWSFKHPDFVAVSATHGSAQLALYDQEMWDKYQLAKLAGHGFENNKLLVDHGTTPADPNNYEDPTGAYSPEHLSIPGLQARGAVFLSCHNAIWEQSSKLHKMGINPDNVSVDVMAAELTNHLIPGVVLTPGAVATLVELQAAGYRYAR